MSRYIKKYKKTKSVSFLIKDDELQEKYNKIWDKVSNVFKKGFASEPVYNEKYLKTSIKSYDLFIMPKKRCHCICLSVTLVDSAFKMGKNCYLQVFLEECKYIAMAKILLNISLMT